VHSYTGLDLKCSHTAAKLRQIATLIHYLYQLSFFVKTLLARFAELAVWPIFYIPFFFVAQLPAVLQPLACCNVYLQTIVNFCFLHFLQAVIALQ
jgi:hypothetical protein